MRYCKIDKRIVMQFQVSNTPDGYIVEANVVTDFNSLIGSWRPLRNFGDRQGDAIAFRDIDCPEGSGVFAAV